MIRSAAPKKDEQTDHRENQYDTDRDRNNRGTRLIFAARGRAEGGHVSGRSAHEVKLYRLSYLDA